VSVRHQGNTTGDQYCINYERVLENGAGLLLEQCLFDSDKSILFGNQTLTVPKDHTKVPTSLQSSLSLALNARLTSARVVCVRCVCVCVCVCGIDHGQLVEHGLV
jgi:hypothetical protein